MVDQAEPKVSPVPTETAPADKDDTLELTEPNEEMVQDEMRPYLTADGGNVFVAEIETYVRQQFPAHELVQNIDQITVVQSTYGSICTTPLCSLQETHWLND